MRLLGCPSDVGLYNLVYGEERASKNLKLLSMDRCLE
jgi:hypothetical protein